MKLNHGTTVGAETTIYIGASLVPRPHPLCEEEGLFRLREDNANGKISINLLRATLVFKK